MARVVAAIAAASAATTRVGGTPRRPTRPRSVGVVGTAGVAGTDRFRGFLPVVPSASPAAVAFGSDRAVEHGLELPFSVHLAVHQQSVGRPLHTNDSEAAVLL